MKTNHDGTITLNAYDTWTACAGCGQRVTGDSIHTCSPQTKPFKCIVKDCENHKYQGGFTGDLCNPCYEFITTGKGVYSQAYRNTQTNPLSDEEIKELLYCWDKNGGTVCDASMIEFARAIEAKVRGEK
jgi:hypothetical protein